MDESRVILWHVWNAMLGMSDVEDMSDIGGDEWYSW